MKHRGIFIRDFHTGKSKPIHMGTFEELYCLYRWFNICREDSGYNCMGYRKYYAIKKHLRPLYDAKMNEHLFKATQWLHGFQ